MSVMLSSSNYVYTTNAVVMSFCVELSHIELVKGIRLYTMKYTK